MSSSQKDSKQQKDSMSIYGKFEFKDSLARNMLSRSNTGPLSGWWNSRRTQ